jgi:hypothetical protein
MTAIPGLGGIAFETAPSCATSLTAACFRGSWRVGRVTGPRALEQWAA